MLKTWFRPPSTETMGAAPGGLTAKFISWLAVVPRKLCVVTLMMFVPTVKLAMSAVSSSSLGRPLVQRQAVHSVLLMVRYSSIFYLTKTTIDTMQQHKGAGMLRVCGELICFSRVLMPRSHVLIALLLCIQQYAFLIAAHPFHLLCSSHLSSRLKAG
jgi:hypothetical protein